MSRKIDLLQLFYIGLFFPHYCSNKNKFPQMNMCLVSQIKGRMKNGFNIEMAF